MNSAPAMNEEPQGRCAVHPERVAAGLCSRCGSYYCDDCADRTSASPLCTSCVEGWGADSLTQTRERCWGKRDGWVWFFGFFGSFGSLVNLAMLLVQGDEYSASLVYVTNLALAIAYFLLLPWARRALFVTLLLGPIHSLSTPAQAIQGLSADAALALQNAVLVGSTVIGALLLWLAYRSPRNKLAFRIEISEHELREVHRRLGSASAVRALVYGLLSLGIPFIGIVGLVFALSTLRKLDRSTAPVGNRRRFAMFGLALSILGTLFWLITLTMLVLFIRAQ
jgi:hypothetical protein